MQDCDCDENWPFVFVAGFGFSTMTLLLVNLSPLINNLAAVDLRSPVNQVVESHGSRSDKKDGVSTTLVIASNGTAFCRSIQEVRRRKEILSLPSPSPLAQRSNSAARQPPALKRRR